MDGKGSWRDNVFIERFWRTVKYEEVYIRAYDSVAEARLSIGRYLEFYNGRRPHSALDRRTPDQAYYASLPHCVAAQEMLHGLRDCELEEHLPAVGEHHDEEGEAAAGIANGDGAPATPVDLSALAREIDGQLCGPDAADVVAHDGDAAAVSLLAHALEDLLSAVGMCIEQSDEKGSRMLLRGWQRCWGAKRGRASHLATVLRLRPSARAIWVAVRP